MNQVPNDDAAASTDNEHRCQNAAIHSHLNTRHFAALNALHSMKNKNGYTLLLIVFVSVLCLWKYSSTLPSLLPQSSSQVARSDVYGEDNNRTVSAPSNQTVISSRSHSNITLEKPWKTINDTKLGIHLFRPRVENIRLIGERHSGTTFLTRYLKQCFPDHSIEDFFVVKKHWMQPSPDYIVQAGKRYGEQGLYPTLLDDLDAKTWWEIANHPNPKSILIRLL